MKYRPTTEFGVLAGELLADLERLRPGIPIEASFDEIQRQCGERVRLRLPEIYREYQADAEDSEADAQLSLYQREMEQLLLPRYTALVSQQHASLRGGGAERAELYNRLTYAAIFFVIGVAVIRAPFIPLWDKWIPFALAALAPLLSPWLPDLQKFLAGKRHGVSLGLLHMDLDQAGRSLPLPPPALPAMPTSSASRASQAQKQ